MNGLGLLANLLAGPAIHHRLTQINGEHNILEGADIVALVATATRRGHAIRRGSGAPMDTSPRRTVATAIRFQDVIILCIDYGEHYPSFRDDPARERYYVLSKACLWRSTKDRGRFWYRTTLGGAVDAIVIPIDPAGLHALGDALAFTVRSLRDMARKEVPVYAPDWVKRLVRVPGIGAKRALRAMASPIRPAIEAALMAGPDGDEAVRSLLKET